MKKVNRFLFTILFCCLVFAVAGLTGAEGAEIQAPSNLQATAVSDSQINLSWTDRSDNEKGFIVERSSSTGSFAEIASLEPNTTTFADTGLLPGVTYFYRVKAYNGEGESAYSNEASAITWEAVPQAPGDLKATVVSSTRIDLSWTDRSDNEKGFKIERRTLDGSYSQVAVVGANATSYTSSGLVPGTTYYYRVCAYNDAGNSAYSNEVTAVTAREEKVPDTPGDLEAVSISSSEIKLTWDDESDNEDGFKIERKKSGGSYTQIATVGKNVTSYTNKGLEAGTRYYYRVRAYNEEGNSPYSNEASATTGEGETIIRLFIGDPSYYVNGKLKTMDTAPFIMEDRTLLPIRYVAEELGARVEWDNDERKVTIALEGTRIELWIERNYAMVDGLYKPIDVYNPNVKPIIVLPGRTMLPLRFIAENLGCQVEWDPARREVKVTYPAP